MAGDSTSNGVGGAFTASPGTIFGDSTANGLNSGTSPGGDSTTTGVGGAFINSFGIAFGDSNSNSNNPGGTSSANGIGEIITAVLGIASGDSLATSGESAILITLIGEAFGDSSANGPGGDGSAIVITLIGEAIGDSSASNFTPGGGSTGTGVGAIIIDRIVAAFGESMATALSQLPPCAEVVVEHRADSGQLAYEALVDQQLDILINSPLNHYPVYPGCKNVQQTVDRELLAYLEMVGNQLDILLNSPFNNYPIYPGCQDVVEESGNHDALVAKLNAINAIIAGL